MNLKNFLQQNRGFIIFAIIIALFFRFYTAEKGRENLALKAEQATIENKTPYYKVVQDSIEAKSFYVLDILKNEAVFAKNEHLKLPLASITKLMSGLIVSDIMPDTTIITINNEDIAMEGDSGLVVGEKWKLKDLLDFSLIESSNDGMHAIAEALNYYEEVNNKDIIKIMNQRADILGLKDTVFINETGLDIDENMSGAYSSAYDVSLLLKKIIEDNQRLISNTNKQKENYISESKIKHTAINTNTYINEIPNLIASKTGFTNLAGGNLVVVFDAGFMHPVVIVVLGSTTDERFSDVVKLAKITLVKLSE
jgi:serine-type D-Ala-D-Ala carboxypeptidase (penicillin-binding protein 5/6)